MQQSPVSYSWRSHSSARKLGPGLIKKSPLKKCYQLGSPGSWFWHHAFRKCPWNQPQRREAKEVERLQRELDCLSGWRSVGPTGNVVLGINIHAFPQSLAVGHPGKGMLEQGCWGHPPTALLAAGTISLPLKGNLGSTYLCLSQKYSFDWTETVIYELF